MTGLIERIRRETIGDDAVLEGRSLRAMLDWSSDFERIRWFPLAGEAGRVAA